MNFSNSPLPKSLRVHLHVAGMLRFMSFDINQPSWPPPFYSALGVAVFTPFQLYFFHKFSRQLFAFSLCSSGLISAFFALSTLYRFLKVSLTFSLRDRISCMAPVEQPGEVSWSMVCAACCHMTQVFAVSRTGDLRMRICEHRAQRFSLQSLE